MESAAGIPVVEPDTPEDAARLLADAAARRRRIVIRGAGTKSAWMSPAALPDQVLGTTRMTRVLAHAESDLTVTCEAGLALDTLNEQLARRRQWLPLDAAFDGATIGGLLATNDAGPLRHRYGTPRDLLIGITLATTEGTLVNAGGRVVKNVAGYDLGKLVTGSFGGLAVIVSATFKLTPLPDAFGTLRATFVDRAAAAAAAAAIAASQLDPLAIDIRFASHAVDGATVLLVRFASVARAVALQIAETERLVAPLMPRDVQSVHGDAERDLWRSHAQDPWRPGGLVARVSWLAASLANVLAVAAELGGQGSAIELAGRAGVGAGVLRIDGDAQAQAVAMHSMRERAVFNQLTVLRADAAVRSAIDMRGQRPEAVPVLAALKRAFDPAGVLAVPDGLW